MALWQQACEKVKARLDPEGHRRALMRTLNEDFEVLKAVCAYCADAESLLQKYYEVSGWDRYPENKQAVLEKFYANGDPAPLQVLVEKLQGMTVSETGLAEIEEVVTETATIAEQVLREPTMRRHISEVVGGLYAGLQSLGAVQGGMRGH